MKTDTEIKETVFKRRDKYLIERKSRIKKASAAAACFVIVAACSAGIAAYVRTGNSPYGNTDGGDVIPSKINIDDFAIREYDEVLTDDEIDAYYSENKGSILSGLSASGVNVSSAVLSEKGYCHIKLEETEITLRASFRDRLLYNGDKLAAIITFVKENGKIYSSPAFGGPWFDTLDAVLSEHKGEKLTFGYIGHLEFMITGSGEIINPAGYVIPALTQDTADKIAEAECEKAIYVP